MTRCTSSPAPDAPDQRHLRGVQRKALLEHAAQVAGADAVADARELHRPLVLRDGLPQDRLARVEREAGGEGVLHLAERARADPAVLRHRLLLLRRADLDLALELATEEEGRDQRGADAPHRVVLLLEDEELARNAGRRTNQRDPRQSRRFCLLDAVERCRDPPLGGDDVRATLEEIGGHPDRHRRGRGRELGAHRDHRRGVASREHLERPQRLLVREVEVLRGVAEALQVRLREAHVVLVADPDPEAIPREAGEALRRAHRLVGERLLHARLGGEEPAFRDLRGDRSGGRTGSRVRSRRTGIRPRPRPSARAPEVELPVHEHTDALQPARVTADLPAAAGEEVHLRVERRARHLLVRRRLLDARRCDAEIRVVGERLPRQTRRAAGR